MTNYQHRQRQRLSGYDYSTPGYYFVTLCIQDRLPLLGKIVDDQVDLSSGGMAIQQLWEELPQRYSGVELDTLVLMPDHTHAILALQ